MVHVAINGFGRIGRLVARALLQRKNIKLVAVNDLTDAHTMAHLFKYDTVHGRYKGNVVYKNDALRIDNKEVRVYAEKDPALLPWKKHRIDVVIECTGRFRTKDTAGLHLKAGAKKVLLSAPAKDKGIKTIVLGVNDKELKKTDRIVSNASCTTNCLAPIVQVLHKNFRIRQGFMTTVHAFTNDQHILDLPHSDLRRARAASMNIIPTTTGAAKAVTLVIPELKGRLDGMAMRVPVQDGSATDFVCIVRNKTTVEEVNKVMKKAANKQKKILRYTEEPLVSSDIIDDPHSSIFDASFTKVLNGNMIKVLAWYDNEWGYSVRLVDLLERMVK